MRAVTRRVEGADAADPRSNADPAESFDIWFRSSRRTLDGTGVAMVVDLPAPWVDNLALVTDALDSFDVDDEVGEAGCGPIAFASFPFDRDLAARVVIPSVVRGSTRGGIGWVTSITDSHGQSPHDVEADAGPDTITVVEIRAPVNPDVWCDSIAEATRRIAAGQVVKVVLARELVVTADAAWSAPEIGERLADLHPQSLRFCVDGHVGASPELLVSRIGDVVRAQPMAGTTPRTGDPAVDSVQATELSESSKNREEHQITIDMVHDSLLGWCSYLDAEPHPSVVAAGSVQHLATMVEGRLAQPAPSVLELIAALHPTPAVGGWPRRAALRFISELEQMDRGRYAGPVGWVDRWGNGAWAVGIRGVEIDGRDARVRAGVGVVADSDPRAELDETRAKLAATLGTLTRL